MCRQATAAFFALLLVLALLWTPRAMAEMGSIDGVPAADAPAAESLVSQLKLSQEELEWLDAHPEITVSNEFDWPPFDFMVSGKPQGFGIDLMNLLSERAGIRFRYINGYTWDQLVEMFFAGRIDVLHSLSITPERQEKALFSPPYYHSKNVLVLRSDASDTNDLRDLEGRIIALPKGWSSIAFFQQNYPGIHIIEVESSRQALEYVDQGKVFATVEQEGIAAYFIRKFGFHDLRLSRWIDNDELQKTSSMHFAVLKDKPVLYAILEKALATIQPGEMAALSRKWFSREGRQIGVEDVGLTPAERAFLQEKKSVTYCAAPDNMPFEAVQGGSVSGMTSDFLEMFTERLGVSFTLIMTESWEQSLAAVTAGRCDILPMVNETEENGQFLDFTSAYLSFEVAIITREKSEFIGGLADLAGKRVALPAGLFTQKVIARKHPQIELLALPTPHDCLLQLSSGKVDAAVLSLPAATYHIRHDGLDNLKVAGYSGQQDVIRVGVRKNDQLLHSIMSKAVRALDPREIEAVTQRWISLTFEHRFDYSLMYRILAVIGVLMVLFLLWNYQLVRLNRQLARAHRELEQKSLELERLSSTDELTGLLNRRRIDSRLSEEVERQCRYEHPLSLIMLDIDHFKRINDTLGHQAGDRVLEQFGALLQAGVRKSDAVGRWGGEEFLVICPDSDSQGAMALAEKLRTQVSAADFGPAGRLTASLGVTAIRPEENRDMLISRTDEALYRAKECGRDRVEHAP